MIMVMSLATVAFAAEDTAAPTYTDVSSVTITKNYNATNTGTTSPAETFNFTIERTSVSDAAEGVTVERMPIPTIGSVSYTAGEAGSATKTKTITINLPEYTSVGVYTYTIKETAGTTAGVTYHSSDITLKVTVVQADTGKVRIAAVHTETEGEKSDEIANEYSAGTLAVSKTVTGNLGDQTKEFTVKVTFTAPEGLTVKEAIKYIEDGTEKSVTFAEDATTAEATIALKHDETVTFTNIPYGVTYTVVEDDYTGEGYDAPVYDFGDVSKKIDTAVDTVGITNNKDTNVDTGITLDSLPFVLILAVSAIAGVLFITKRRSVEF